MRLAFAFIALLLCGLSLPSLSGLLVFPFSMVPEGYDLPYRLALSALFLTSAFWAKRRERFKKYANILFAFFIASAAINLQTLSAFPNLSVNPTASITVSMLLSTILVVVAIIGLTIAMKDGLPYIFLCRGRLREGMTVGLAGFTAFALVSIPAATNMFQGRDLSLERIIPWLPLILVTVLANGIREELLYRGIFLGRLPSVLGVTASNVLQAAFFSLSHTVAGRGSLAYTPYTAAFVIFTFVLGLTWGHLMQKTGSVLGSVLFHAGSDIPVFLGIFSNL